MRPFCLEKRVVLCAEQVQKKNPAVPNPYRTDLLTLLAASKFVPLLSLEIRASSLLKTLLQKMGNFSFSCSLSISQSLQERMTSHLAFFLL
jgi:hypothetical protein